MRGTKPYGGPRKPGRLGGGKGGAPFSHTVGMPPRQELQRAERGEQRRGLLELKNAGKLVENRPGRRRENYARPPACTDWGQRKARHEGNATSRWVRERMSMGQGNITVEEA